MDFVAAMNQILEMDRAGKVEETLPLMREMLAQPFRVPRILFAGIVYSFSETKVLTGDGEVKAKWEICQIDQDRPISQGWVEFCEDHLKVPSTTASRYKRVWEVFVVGLGYEPGDLAEVSVGNLADAIGSLAGLSLEDQMCLVDDLVGGEPFVYFIQCEDGPIKIGRTRNLTRRLQRLQCASPFVLSLLGFSVGLDESVVHEKFASLHIRGEWYRPAAELLDFIEKECT